MMLSWLSKIYGYFTDRRNRAFDSGERPSVSFDRPIISIGNLNTGGTGKTPHVEYLVRLLQDQYKLGILSRGYGRKTKGYRLAGPNDSAETLGDEPYQYRRKFDNQVQVAVSEKRVLGASELIADTDPDVIVLDDAFQHRQIKPGLQLLLTTHQEPYSRDQLLPKGRLRERADGAHRADAIILTKCPHSLSEEDRQSWKKELAPMPHQPLFFSTFTYGDIEAQSPVEIANPMQVIALAGIAKPEPFLDELKNRYNVVSEHVFRDHYRFSKKDLLRLRRDVEQHGKETTAIVTTEKDFTRLLPFRDIWKEWALYVLPIEARIEPKAKFDQMIFDYVGKSK
ncbi:tetraacyldisaccharide 4'-kinase [Cryomorphaceae bacterium]|nr:tetraacyldisaccharide 4'-kinase [Cryomorphaceae bacterium]